MPPKKTIPLPKIFSDATKLVEIGNAIQKHLIKKGISSDLNIHLYPR